MFIKRTLSLRELLRKKSHFLFGPRGTGKTKLITETMPPSVQFIDMLNDDIYSRLVRRPASLDEFITPGAKLIVIDEIQKIPALLDEVHRLIECRQLKFLLTGSSARKLRHGGGNLLGGRAWEAKLFPLTSFELGKQFDLLTYLNRGGLPAVYFSKYPQDEQRNYIKLYLREEIQAEALVKRFDHFARFLDIAALTNSQELNYENIANDSGVPARTVASYYEVLEDTLIGFQVPSFDLTRKRKAIKRSKFYLFDVGMAGALARRGTINDSSELFGRALEHFIAQELRAFINYRNLDLSLCYWRSTTQHEVDFVVGRELAIEVKSSKRVSERSLSGLKALAEEKLVKSLIIVSQDPIARVIDGFQVMAWDMFLEKLWQGELIS